METKRVILARFVDFDVTPTNVPDFPQNYFFVETFLQNQFWQSFASILNFLSFS